MQSGSKPDVPCSYPIALVGFIVFTYVLLICCSQVESREVDTGIRFQYSQVGTAVFTAYSLLVVGLGLTAFYAGNRNLACILWFLAFIWLGFAVPCGALARLTVGPSGLREAGPWFTRSHIEIDFCEVESLTIDLSESSRRPCVEFVTVNGFVELARNPITSAAAPLIAKLCEERGIQVLVN